MLQLLLHDAALAEVDARVPPRRHLHLVARVPAGGSVGHDKPAHGEDDVGRQQADGRRVIGHLTYRKGWRSPFLASATCIAAPPTSSMQPAVFVAACARAQATALLVAAAARDAEVKVLAGGQVKGVC